MIIGYSNLAESASSVAASTEAAGFPKENAYDWRLDDWWQPTSIGASLTFDLGSAQSVNYVAFAGHDFGTQGSTWEWYSSTDNFYTATQRATGTPTSDAVIFKTFNSVSARYWRLLVNSGTVFSLGHISFGVYYTPPVGLQPGSIMPKYGIKNTYLPNIGETGLFIGRSVERQLYETSIEMNFLTAAQMRTDIDPLIAHAISKPFFYNWDNTNYPTESAYCWLSGDPDIQTSSALYHSVRLPITAVI